MEYVPAYSNLLDKDNQYGLDFSKLEENNKNALLSEINKYSYNQFYLENNMLTESLDSFNQNGSKIFSNDLLSIKNKELYIEVEFTLSTIDENGNRKIINGGFCTYDKNSRKGKIIINPNTAYYTSIDGNINKASPCGVLIHELSRHLLPEVNNTNGNAIENENAIRTQLGLPLRKEDAAHVCF